MRAGLLRHRITIQNRTTTPDGYGGQTVTFVDVDTVWAAVMPLRSREYWQAQQIQATTSHEIEMRYNPEITIGPEDQVLFGTRTFTIDSIRNMEERDIKTMLLCTEVL